MLLVCATLLAFLVSADDAARRQHERAHAAAERAHVAPSAAKAAPGRPALAPLSGAFPAR